MPQDRLDQNDPLAFLGLKEREMLGKLAELDGRTELEELRWLIRARVSGQLRNQGDDASRPLISEDALADYIHVKSSRVLRQPSELDDSSQSIQNRPKPK